MQRLACSVSDTVVRDAAEKKTVTYKALVAYQKAYTLTLSVYKTTSHFPEAEKYGLVSQLRRCAVSIPSNISEGYRRGRKEYLQFLRVSFGSCGELETQLSLSRDLGYLSDRDFREVYSLQEEVSRLLGAMIRRMDAKK